VSQLPPVLQRMLEDNWQTWDMGPLYAALP
jgi:hypothetical protein